MTYIRRSAEKYCSIIYFIAINYPQCFQDGIVRELDALNPIFKVPWIFLRELYWVPPHIFISITSPSLSSSFKLQWNAFGFIFHLFSISASTHLLPQHMQFEAAHLITFILLSFWKQKITKAARNSWNDACWYGYFSALQHYLGAQAKKLEAENELWIKNVFKWFYESIY